MRDTQVGGSPYTIYLIYIFIEAIEVLKIMGINLI